MLITTGPPKSGTTALKRLSIMLGFEPLPGALIFDEWKRHTPEVENATKVSKEIVKNSIVRMTAEDAYAALREGTVLHGHIPPPVPLDIPCIVILRDPRHCMVSWFRAKQQSKRRITERHPNPVARAAFKKWMKKSGRRAAIFIRPIYDGWLSEPPRDTLLIIHYETLFTNKTMQLVADFVGRPPVAYRDLYGKGSKFSGLPTEAAGWYDEETEARFQITWETASVQSANGESSGARVLDRARGVGVRVRKPEAGQEPSELGAENS